MGVSHLTVPSLCASDCAFSAIFFVAFSWNTSSLHLLGAQRKITVRFLDPKSGKPIRKMWVGVTQYKGRPPKGPIPADYRLAFTSAKTDRNGEVAVRLHNLSQRLSRSMRICGTAALLSPRVKSLRRASCWTIPRKEHRKATGSIARVALASNPAPSWTGVARLRPQQGSDPRLSRV